MKTVGLEPLVGPAQLLLRCPKCRRETMVDRAPTDYPEAVRIEVACDRCNAGDFAEVMQFDAAGRHITRDPDERAGAVGYMGDVNGPGCDPDCR